jgi:23S rRNA (guanosine2251-2'-O)-methyltransferase
MLNKNHIKAGGPGKNQTRQRQSNSKKSESASKETNFTHKGGFMRRNLKNNFEKSEGVLEKSFFIYGKHAVLSAIQNKPECIEAVFIVEDVLQEKSWKDRVSEIKSKYKIEVHTFEEKTLPRDLLREIDNFATHQGCMAKINPENLVIDGKKFIEDFKVEANSCFVVLGEITDVQNVGSIIRSSAGMSAAGIFVPEHNQAPITGAVVKISAGNAFSIPLLSIGNVNNTLKSLKDKGFWVYGLEMSGQNIYGEKFTKPSVFVIGNEGAGIREKTKENCDILISIPINKKCESLNAAVSTAIALSEFRRQNPLV